MDEHGLFLESLKWIALVFAAGFVGFFGKFLGKILISFFHRGESASSGEIKPQKEHQGGEQQEYEKPSALITPANRHFQEQPGELHEGTPVLSLPVMKPEEDKITEKQDKHRRKYEKKLQKVKIKEQKK
jgi:hypothetical protein